MNGEQVRGWVVRLPSRQRVKTGVKAARPGPDATIDPFDRLLTSIQLDEALRRLSPEHREVVIEVHFHGRTCADLGDELGIPASTARARLYYGVRSLRLILEENGGLSS